MIYINSKIKLSSYSEKSLKKKPLGKKNLPNGVMFLITELVYGTVTAIKLLFIVMLNESLKQDMKIWSKDRNFLFLKWYDSNLFGRLKSPIPPRDMSSLDTVIVGVIS